MRLLRWKGRFQTGDTSVDRRNRAFVACLNRLISAADQREHCRELEDFIDRFSSEADRALQERPADRKLRHEFGRHLLASLPLVPFGSNACRKCSLCDLAQERAAEHLAAPARCLFDGGDP